MGYLVLQGGCEFGGRMRDSDLRAMALAGGNDAQVCIVPAAAAPDHNHERAGQNGLRWFQSLGARHTSVLALIDRESAADPEIAACLSRSRLIYLLGGFPGYLASVLKASLCWEAIRHALAMGAVLAGSSAGAMVMGEMLYDPRKEIVVEGLGLLKQTCVVPHFDTFGRQWVNRLQKDLPSITLLGIDEETGAVDDGSGRSWLVAGKGGVALMRNQQIETYRSSEMFDLQGRNDK